MPIEEFIINTYCLIDDLYQELFPGRIRTRGYEPKLSDSEVITIEIVGEWLGHYKDMFMHYFMHYAFDHWLERHIPGVWFERYADDALIHCRTRQEAEFILERVRERLKD